MRALCVGSQSSAEREPSTTMAIIVSASRLEKLSSEEQRILLEILRATPNITSSATIRTSRQELERSTQVNLVAQGLLNVAFSRRAMAREKELLKSALELRAQRESAFAADRHVGPLDAEIASVEAAVQMNHNLLSQLDDEFEDIKAIVGQDEPVSDEEDYEYRPLWK